MICKGCGRNEDCRLGFCFDCATAGEAKAAARTVAQHIKTGVWHLRRGAWANARIDFSWAWERFTKTGDYKPGGEFERVHGIKC